MDDRTSVFVDAVQATRERMYRVARMMLRTDADAEDAVSTAMMIAWKQLPRLRNLDALPAYLTRCTVNAARAGLPENIRGEALSLQQFADLTNSEQKSPE